MVNGGVHDGSRIKVFHVVTHFDVGGAERVAVSIARSATASMEYHVVEVIRGHSDYTAMFIDELRSAGITYHRAWLPEVHFHYLFERMAAAVFPLWFSLLCVRHRPSVIHSHTEVPDMAVFALFTVFPCLKKRCRIVRTIHNTRLWTGLGATGRMVERFFKRHGNNIAISRSVQDSYMKVYGERPPIIYNGVEAAETYGDDGERPVYDGLVAGKTNILFAGRMEPQKGIDTLIRVVTMLKDDDRYHFHILGDGRMRGQVEQRLGALGNVTLRLPLHGLKSYLHCFDYLFMPSEFEGLSILAIEAGMEGLPVIANSCAGLVDTLPEGWPLAVKDNDIGAYMHLFGDVLPTVSRERLSREARLFAERHFGVRLMQERYEEVYRRITSSQ